MRVEGFRWLPIACIAMAVAGCSDVGEDGSHLGVAESAAKKAGATAGGAQAIVDAQCPCDGNWANHQKYVSCVEAAASALRSSGAIKKNEEKAIVAAAKANSCGDPSSCTTNGNPCLVCNGLSTPAPQPSGTPCPDSDQCNGAETCNGAGTCVAGTPPSIDDGNACTIDSCVANLGVQHTPAPQATSCADADECNGLETCNGAGTCQPGAPDTIPASCTCPGFSQEICDGADNDCNGIVDDVCDVETGLIASYRFDSDDPGVAKDSAGNHDGTLTGATLATRGISGAAVSLGGNAQLAVPHDASFDTAQMTVEGWYKPAMSGGTSMPNGVFVDAGAYGIDIVDGAPRARVVVGGNLVLATGTTTLPWNTWSHLRAVFDGTELSLYVNGEPQASTSVTGSLDTSTNSIVAGQGLFGQIDELRLYDRPVREFLLIHPESAELFERFATPGQHVRALVQAWSSFADASLTFDLVEAPEGLAISTEQTAAGRYARLDWTVAPAQTGSWPIVFSVSDGHRSVVGNYTVQVSPVDVRGTAAISKAEGGISRAEAGSSIDGAAVTVAPDAIGADTTIDVAEVLAPPPLDDGTAVGPSVEFDAHGVQFVEPTAAGVDPKLYETPGGYPMALEQYIHSIDPSAALDQLSLEQLEAYVEALDAAMAEPRFVVEVPYDPAMLPAGANPADIRLFKYWPAPFDAPGFSGWVEVKGSEVDTTNHVVRARVRHLSQHRAVLTKSGQAESCANAYKSEFIGFVSERTFVEATMEIVLNWGRKKIVEWAFEATTEFMLNKFSEPLRGRLKVESAQKHMASRVTDCEDLCSVRQADQSIQVSCCGSCERFDPSKYGAFGVPPQPWDDYRCGKLEFETPALTCANLAGGYRPTPKLVEADPPKPACDYSIDVQITDRPSGSTVSPDGTLKVGYSGGGSYAVVDYSEDPAGCHWADGFACFREFLGFGYGHLYDCAGKDIGITQINQCCFSGFNGPECSYVRNCGSGSCNQQWPDFPCSDGQVFDYRTSAQLQAGCCAPDTCFEAKARDDFGREVVQSFCTH